MAPPGPTWYPTSLYAAPPPDPPLPHIAGYRLDCAVLHQPLGDTPLPLSHGTPSAARVRVSGILDDLLHILWDGHARPDDIFAYLMRHSLPRLRAFWTGLACEPTPAPAAPARHATLLAADSPLRDVHQSIVLFLDWQSLARVRRAARSLDHAVRRVAQGRLVAGRCALEVLQETPFASRVLRALDVPGAERPTASCAPDEADPGAAPLRAPPVVWERPVSSGAAPACLGAAAGRPAFWHHVMAPAAPAAEADALPLPDLFERYCTHYVHACPADARRWWPLVAECVGRGAWGPRATHAWCETALAGAPALVVLRYSAPQPLHVTEARLRDLLGAGDRDLPCDFEARAHIRYVPDAFHGLAAGPGRAPGADWRAWGWEYVWEVVRAALGAAAGPEAQEKILMALWTRFRGADHCVWRRVWYDAETLGLVESVSAPVGTVLGRVLARVAALRPC